MSQLFLPTDASDVLGPDGKFTRVWRSYFSDLHIRVGGMDSYSVNDVEASGFDDAGIEEMKGEVNRNRDQASVLPVQIMAVESAMIVMREELANLQAEIANALARLDELAQIRVELDGLKSGTVVI